MATPPLAATPVQQCCPTCLRYLACPPGWRPGQPPVHVHCDCGQEVAAAFDLDGALKLAASRSSA